MKPTAYAGPEPFAFVSYARSDEQQVFPLLRQMADIGARFWYDQGGLSGSQLWMRELAKRITACQIFVLCLTPRAMSSEWVLRELEFAVEQKRPILPIVIEPTEVPLEVRFLVHNRQHLHAHALDRAQLVEQLRSALKEVCEPPVSRTSRHPAEWALEQLREAGAFQAEFYRGDGQAPPGWSVATAVEGRFGLGGDLCMVLSDRSQHLTGILMDVTGHGARASVLSNFLNGAIRATWSPILRAEQLAGQLNDMILEGQAGNLPVFVTGVLIDIDAASGSADVVAAGMPLLHVRAGPARVVEVNTTMMPLGIDRTIDIASARLHLEKGEALVVVSDGVFEQLNPRGEMFGLQRLRGVVGTAAAGGRDVLKDVAEALREFRGTTPVGDDWSVLAIIRE